MWLNTCKLCCDYQPLKSSLKINLYIVKFTSCSFHVDVSLNMCTEYISTFILNPCLQAAYGHINRTTFFFLTLAPFSFTLLLLFFFFCGRGGVMPSSHYQCNTPFWPQEGGHFIRSYFKFVNLGLPLLGNFHCGSTQPKCSTLKSAKHYKTAH